VFIVKVLQCKSFLQPSYSDPNMWVHLSRYIILPSNIDARSCQATFMIDHDRLQYSTSTPMLHPIRNNIFSMTEKAP
jgi:hypothetical protein